MNNENEEFVADQLKSFEKFLKELESSIKKLSNLLEIKDFRKNDDLHLSFQKLHEFISEIKNFKENSFQRFRGTMAEIFTGNLKERDFIASTLKTQMILSTLKDRMDILGKQILLSIRGAGTKVDTTIRGVLGIISNLMNIITSFFSKLLQTLLQLKEFSVGGEVEMGAIFTTGKVNLEFTFEPHFNKNVKTTST